MPLCFTNARCCYFFSWIAPFSQSEHENLKTYLAKILHCYHNYTHTKKTFLLYSIAPFEYCSQNIKGCGIIRHCVCVCVFYISPCCRGKPCLWEYVCVCTLSTSPCTGDLHSFRTGRAVVRLEGGVFGTASANDWRQHSSRGMEFKGTICPRCTISMCVCVSCLHHTKWGQLKSVAPSERQTEKHVFVRRLAPERKERMRARSLLALKWSLQSFFI